MTERARTACHDCTLADRKNEEKENMSLHSLRACLTPEVLRLLFFHAETDDIRHVLAISHIDTLQDIGGTTTCFRNPQEQNAGRQKGTTTSAMPNVMEFEVIEYITKSRYQV